MNGLSLFSNVGIAELLLENLDFQVVVANELLPKRADVYTHTFPNTNMITGDINIFLDDIVHSSLDKGVDFIIATPPCQGMSTAGRMHKYDTRNELIIPTVSAIIKILPKYVMIENVSIFPKTIIKIGDVDIKISDYIDLKLSSQYSIKFSTVNSMNYSIPQNRQRCIYLLSRKDVDEWQFPDKNEKQISVRDTIGHLPTLNPFVKNEKTRKITPKSVEEMEKILSIHKLHLPPTHIERHINMMKHTPSGKSAYNNSSDFLPRKLDGTLIKGFGSCYKRIDWDKPSPTITTNSGAISSQNNVHPGREENGIYTDPRVLTIYELMLLHSIPLEWNIPFDLSQKFIRTIIGESIPPKLVAEFFKQLT